MNNNQQWEEALNNNDAKLSISSTKGHKLKLNNKSSNILKNLFLSISLITITSIASSSPLTNSEWSSKIEYIKTNNISFTLNNEIIKNDLKKEDKIDQEIIDINSKVAKMKKELGLSSIDDLNEEKIKVELEIKGLKENIKLLEKDGYLEINDLKEENKINQEIIDIDSKVTKMKKELGLDSIDNLNEEKIKAELEIKEIKENIKILEKDEFLEINDLKKENKIDQEITNFRSKITKIKKQLEIGLNSINDLNQERINVELEIKEIKENIKTVEKEDNLENNKINKEIIDISSKVTKMKKELGLDSIDDLNKNEYLGRDLSNYQTKNKSSRKTI